MTLNYLLYMIKKEVNIKEFGDVPAQPPAQYQQVTNSIINADFLKFMMSAENAAQNGRDPKTGLWKPHVSPEGGLETIGYGHKLHNWLEVKKYIEKPLSDKEIIKLLQNDLIEANKKVHKYIGGYYRAKIMLNQKQEEMLTEFAFNLGGLEKFPKFVEAVLRNDINTMRREFKRFYRTPGGVKPIEMERRNKLFYDRYLSSPIKENVKNIIKDLIIEYLNEKIK